MITMNLKLDNPKVIIESPFALAHDFYYFSDEFRLVERIDWVGWSSRQQPPTVIRVSNFGEEHIPILSTWSHLRRDKHERGIEEAFAFFENRWWEITNINETPIEGEHLIETSVYDNLSWCCCNSHRYIYQGYEQYHIPNFNGTNHSVRKRYNEQEWTLFKDKHEFDELYNFIPAIKEDYSMLGIVADWLEDRGDPFAVYLREVALLIPCPNYTLWGSKAPKYRLAELEHMCQFITTAKNYRAAKLILLAESLQFFRDGRLGLQEGRLP